MTQATALSILKLGHTTFLTGAAGAGKSYALREYISYLKKHGIKYAVTASTGIASTHINGTTIHAWSGIGIKQKLHTYDLDAMEEKQSLYKKWNETEVLIIDEVSMLHASFVDMLDKVAKHLRRNEKPFGGMQVVFTGDFFQLPPVVRGNNEYESQEVFAFTSRAWKDAKPVVCYLTEQFRQDDDKLSAILDAIRKGEVEEEHFEALQKTSTKKHKEDHIKLYTHNENVDQINKKAFDEIKGDIRSYEMITKGKASIVESLKNNCLAEEVLELKKGAKVICLKNAVDRSYVNGSMGVVVDFNNEGAPVVELNNGKKVTIKADSWKVEEDGKVRAELQQLPLKLAWAITVHKSQGMTLEMAEIDLSRAFASGQGYVALSRLKSLDGLNLKGFNPQALQVADEVREADMNFREKSKQAENAIKKYPEKDLQKLWDKFILDADGELKEKEIDEAEEIAEKKPSYILTMELLNEGKKIKEVAKEREIKTNTVLDHLEKLVEEKFEVKIEHLMPKEKDKKVILKSFEKLETRKLTPVYEELKGKYEYDVLRVVRLLL